MSFNRFLEKSITASQRCQRNWDLDKKIPEEDIKTMKISVTECSSKQNRVFYKAIFIQDREKIEAIHEATDGFVYNLETGASTTNPQTLANLLVAFVDDRDPSEGTRTTEEYSNGRIKGEYKHDADIALGVGSGYLTLAANLLGYKTGCCQCFDTKEVGKILGEEKPLLLMGIGYPGKNKSRLEHHKDPNFRFPSFNKHVIVEDL
jgi:nitroreductase|tara:strand:+ start:1055 stop:1669 length:615 start_codon:yes stop_codon:yes gene_type:complete